MKRLIDYHYEWMQAGEIPTSGLCPMFNIPHSEFYPLDGILNEKYGAIFKLFHPTIEDELIAQKTESTGWWGSGEIIYSPEKQYSYTPRRQTIVLFICAMHGEI